jgi:homoserine kinase
MFLRFFLLVVAALLLGCSAAAFIAGVYTVTYVCGLGTAGLTMLSLIIGAVSDRW